MSSVQSAANFGQSIRDLDNAALFNQITQADSEKDRAEIEIALRLASVLQTSLNIEQVFTTFIKEVNQIVPITGADYSNSAINTHCQFGEKDKHSVTYRLTVTEQALGEISFSRRKKFTIKETKFLEYLLCGLVYPLKNAISYQEALQAALKDPLTGVYNRASMDNTIAREVELAKRHKTCLSLIAIDIDHFKHINDTFGHSSGDCVIRAVADLIEQTVRGTDIVFRYGGEEFVVLLSNTDIKGAVLLAERIRRKVEACEIACNGANISATISSGVAWLENNETPQTLFNKADKALYAAKSGGRNCVRHTLTEKDYEIASQTSKEA